tara:strand:+ start:2096 stop:3295 length:1200 start_codon:yes stop_codon:yes gene_type:complete
MKKKIIFISSVDLTKYYSKIFGIDYLIKKNINVEYWYSHFIYKIKKKPKDIVKLRYKKTINSINDFKKKIYKEKNNPTAVVLLLSLDYRSIEIYKIIKKFNIKSASFLWDLDPTLENTSKNIFINLYKKFLTKLNYKQFLTVIYSFCKIKLYKYFNLIKESEIIFYTGSLAKNILKKKNTKSKLVGINSNDNDRLLECRKKKRIIKNKKYCVFLDSAMTSIDHIDKYIFGEKDMAGLHSSYFRSLNSFFLEIETKYKIKIVISRHPKSKLNIKKYLNRPVYDYKSPELVKEAEFVICHQSLSLSYAILLNKPIIFIYTQKMFDQSEATHNLVNTIKLFGKKLGQKVFNIDKNFTLPEINQLKPDKKKYNLYKKNYLLEKNNQEIYSKKIFYENLKTILK